MNRVPDTAFPPNFLFGVSSSSYQIEGAHDRDGKGLGVWDTFCERTGVVEGNEHGQVACAHYDRFREDVGLLERLESNAYRFSISWPRVLPDGVGATSSAGLAFYDRLVDALLEAGVTPWVTLFHWDYPLELFRRGGWLNRDSVEWFADYAALIARTLGDRVRHFFTLNEPQVYLGLGHHEGKHAPGLQLPFRDVLLAGHHSLLAHGRAVQALRAHSPRPVEVGIAPVAMPCQPESESSDDIEAARAAMFSVETETAWTNSWWMDPVCLGHYPADGLERYARFLPRITSDDLALIAEPTDFLGVNIYQGDFVRRGPNGPERQPFPVGFPRTGFNWPITPEALRWGPRFLSERYGKPIYITENGLSTRDVLELDGRVRDPQRIDFTKRYLRQLHRALVDGADVRGYFHWSLLDNFEWAGGYRERFGLVFTDYRTLERTPKQSYYWYRSLIRSEGRAAFELRDD